MIAMALLVARQPQLSGPPPPAIAFAKLPFKGLATENESQVNTLTHEANPRVERIYALWKELKASRLLLVFDREVYEEACDIVRGIRCSARDLEAFVMLLTAPSPQDTLAMDRFECKTGVFISALINGGIDEYYTLDIRNIGSTRLRGLGCNNRKNVVIIGDTGYNTGDEMEAGTLTLIGNTGARLGCDMRGGKIIVHGNCGEGIGRSMSGGEIHIYGKPHLFDYCECNGISYIGHNGQIFVNGKQVNPVLKSPELNREVV